MGYIDTFYHFFHIIFEEKKLIQLTLMQLSFHLNCNSYIYSFNHLFHIFLVIKLRFFCLFNAYYWIELN